MIRRRRNFIIV